MRKAAMALGIAIFLVGSLVYFRWSSAIRQPLGFSHSQHVRGGIPCATCHEAGRLDSLPPVALCSNCHSDLTLPQQTRWVRVYRVAPDIIFPHARHLQDDCTVCHKDITAGKRWVHESRFTMDFCMKCHAQRGANNACGVCHKNR